MQPMQNIIRTAGVILFLAASACAPRGPVIDAGAKPSNVGGTIAGLVRTAGANTPLSARMVTAIDVATGARFQASTGSNGGYTIKVPKGKYRLEVELHQGEVLAERPDDTEIVTGDMDTGRNFAVTAKPPA
jgi:hypothetical protein